MKKGYLLLGITAVFALSTACSNEVPGQNQEMQSTETGESGKTQFTIAGMLTTTEANTFKEEYQDQVDVEINIEICQYFDGEYEKYVQQLSTQLMAGTAPDVFYLPGELFFDFSASPYIYDINQFFSSDITVNRSDYYENILDAFEVKGKLPVWPSSVYFIPFVGLHSDLSGSINPAYFEKDTITYREMLQYYYELDDEIKAENSLFKTHNAFSTLLIGEPFDYKNQQFYFASDEYIELLQLSKGAADPVFPDTLGYMHYGIYAQEAEQYRYVFNTPLLSQKDLFLPSKDDYWYEFDNSVNPPFLEGPSGLFTDLKPLVSEKGQLFLGYNGHFAVNANSEHLDLAWEFLKYAATDKVVPYILKTHDIMLHKELNQQYMYEDLEYYVKAAMIGTALPGQASRNAIVLTDEHETDIRETAEMLLQYCEMPMVLTIGDIPEIMPILEEYANDIITAEQAALQLQNKASLMLME